MAKGQKTGGRKPGSLNKTTVAAKEAFQLAFEGIGGAQAFADWAKENQTDFYKLYSKLIPTDVNANLTAHQSILDVLQEINARGRPRPGG